MLLLHGEEQRMRVSSEETLRRVLVARRSGKSWIEMTRSEDAIRNGLEFFAGSKGAASPTGGWRSAARKSR